MNNKIEFYFFDKMERAFFKEAFARLEATENEPEQKSYEAFWDGKEFGCYRGVLSRHFKVYYEENDKIIYSLKRDGPMVRIFVASNYRGHEIHKEISFSYAGGGVLTSCKLALTTIQDSNIYEGIAKTIFGYSNKGDWIYSAYYVFAGDRSYACYYGEYSVIYEDKTGSGILVDSIKADIKQREPLLYTRLSKKPGFNKAPMFPGDLEIVTYN